MSNEHVHYYRMCARVKNVPVMNICCLPAPKQHSTLRRAYPGQQHKRTRREWKSMFIQSRQWEVSSFYASAFLCLHQQIGPINTNCPSQLAARFLLFFFKSTLYLEIICANFLKVKELTNFICGFDFFHYVVSRIIKKSLPYLRSYFHQELWTSRYDVDEPHESYIAPREKLCYHGLYTCVRTH